MEQENGNRWKKNIEAQAKGWRSYRISLVIGDQEEKYQIIGPVLQER